MFLQHYSNIIKFHNIEKGVERFKVDVALQSYMNVIKENESAH